MVIGIENVDFLLFFFVKVKNGLKNQQQEKKNDHVETLKVWPYNM
jgi:hypothetical protein